MSYDINKVIKIAEDEVGYLEKSKKAYQANNKIIYEKTEGAGYDNYTKYGKEMHDVYPQVMDYPAYWCDAFVDWCFYKAYGVSTAKSLLGGNFDDYTVNSAKLYKAKKAYIDRGAGTPKRGDQIFFNNGTKGSIYHTGIVYQVDSARVYTIEGNTSGGSSVVANGGGVFKKSYPLNYNRIDGYGRPKYGDQSSLNNPTSNRYDMLFNAEFYLAMNTDLKKNLGENPNANTLKNHFITYGINEGRIGSPVFDPKYYRDKYVDLRNAFGSNMKKYYDHFLDCGLKEGRASSEVFNVKDYMKLNKDLEKAFSTDYVKQINHFLSCGLNEFRKTSSKFDVKAYKTKNKDLERAFGTNTIKYFIHYYLFGKKEGRVTV